VCILTSFNNSIIKPHPRFISPVEAGLSHTQPAGLLRSAIFNYTENGGRNLVGNPSFASGLNIYGSWGSGSSLLKVLPSDQGAGRMLHVTGETKTIP
jgi:hypothetical protein